MSIGILIGCVIIALGFVVDLALYILIRRMEGKMNMTDLILQNIFDFLLLKEARDLGMIDDEEWKEIVVTTMKIERGFNEKGEHDGNEH